MGSKVKSPIGFLDSGIGGLTTLHQFRLDAPGEDIVFIGDNKNMPYGSRSELEIERLSLECCDYLMEHGVKMIVIACNTISSVCYEKIKAAYDVPVVEVLEPALKNAFGATKKCLGVVGTERTIATGVHKKMLDNLGIAEISLWGAAIPPLATAIEEMASDAVIDDILRAHLGDMPKDVDTLLLACTHYPWVKSNFARILPNANILDASKPTSLAIRNRLEKMGGTSTGNDGSVSFYFTKETNILEKIKERYNFEFKNFTLERSC